MYPSKNNAVFTSWQVCKCPFLDFTECLMFIGTYLLEQCFKLIKVLRLVQSDFYYVVSAYLWMLAIMIHDWWSGVQHWRGNVGTAQRLWWLQNVTAVFSCPTSTDFSKKTSHFWRLGYAVLRTTVIKGLWGEKAVFKCLVWKWRLPEVSAYSRKNLNVLPQD